MNKSEGEVSGKTIGNREKRPIYCLDGRETGLLYPHVTEKEGEREMKRRIIAMLLATLMLLGAAACSSDESAGGGNAAGGNNAGNEGGYDGGKQSITIAIGNTYRPFCYVNENEEPDGYEYDLFQLLA